MKGRPRIPTDVRALARPYSAEAIATIVRIMRGRDARLALEAARALLDRAHGKPGMEHIIELPTANAESSDQLAARFGIFFTDGAPGMPKPQNELIEK